MYLLDTNVFLEILLDQEQSIIAQAILNRGDLDLMKSSSDTTVLTTILIAKSIPGARRMIILSVNPQILTSFSKQYHISAIWVFGSVIRNEVSNHSDIDLVVEFTSEATPILLNLASMESDLEKIYNRKVDLITRDAIEEFMNPILRQEVLSTMVQVYGS